MSNELAVLQNELTVARQQNEIMQLRFELQKAQAQKTSRLEDSLFAPALYPHYQKVAETLAKSSVIPTIYRNKPEDIFVAMAMGYQLGFPVEQSLQDIAVINGRPCLWGDGLLSLALNDPECQSIKEDPLRNPKGEVIGNSKLKEVDVLFIRHWLDCGYNNTAVGEVFGVTKQNVKYIKVRRTWSHVNA